MEMFNLCILIVLAGAGLTWANEVCYSDLGCFDNAPPFLDLQERPLSVLPSDREDINTTFALNTPYNPNGIADQQLLSNQDLNTISSSSFDFDLRTKFIIHGYVEGGDLTWMTEMGDAILTEGGYNVIRVEWSLKPGNDHYAKMSSNSRIVGAEISLLIDQLIASAPLDSVASNPMSYHLIGRGIGAHAAGYAGERHNPKLGRISGIDPAGPYFEKTDLIVKLDHTDADFVDIIHSDSNVDRRIGLGTFEATGHADFYPNGGHQQPACPDRIISILFIDGTIYEGGIQYVRCDHEKAHEMYLESILSSCRFMSSLTPDNNLNGYIDGAAGYYDATNAMPMGYHADKSFMSGTTIYLQSYITRTGDKEDEPHCRSQYRAHVFFDDPPEAEEAHGDLYIRYGSDENRDWTEKIYHGTTGEGVYEAGMSYYVTGVGESFAAELDDIEFSWEYDGDWYKPWSWDLFRNPDVYVPRIEVDSLDLRKSASFCNTANDNVVKAGKDDVLFRLC